MTEKPPGSANTTGASTARWAIGFLIATALAVWFGDRVGFEGDDLAIIAGSAHFDLRPIESLYRYPWQPLSFVALHGLIRSGVPPLSLIWITHIVSAIGLVFLAETLRGVLRMPGRTLIAYGAILAIPELWMTTLYFSTTAVGLPLFTGALWLLFTAADNEKGWSWKVTVAAAAYAVACLFRLDFATAAMAMLLIVYERTPQRKWRSVFLFVAVAAALGLSSLPALQVKPLDILNEAGQLDGELWEWEPWRSRRVLGLAMLPILAMSPFLVLELRRRDWPRQAAIQWVLIAVAALAVLTPLKSLYSGKYLVPAFCLLLIVLALLLRRSPGRKPGTDVTAVPPFTPLTVWACSVILVVAYCVGVHKDEITWRKSVTLLRASNEPTHDGPRPLGAYLGLLSQVRDPEQRPVYVSLNRDLAQKILQAPGNSTVEIIENHHGPGSEWSTPEANNWTWGWPALYLQEQGWRVESYVLKKRVVMRAPDGRKADFQVKEESTDIGASGDCVLVVGPARFGKYEDLERVAEQVTKASCGR